MTNILPNPNLRFIGSLRGLAALWIVLYHARFLPSPQPGVPLWASIFVDVGGMAVMLFFVISAFSLMYTYPSRLKSRRPKLDFYLHRFFRIAPLFYVVLFFYLLWDKIQLNFEHPVVSIISNLTFTYNLFPGQQTAIVWAGWTIGVEIFFYLIFPYVFHYCKSLIKSIHFLLVTLIVANLSKRLLAYFVHEPSQLAIYQQWFFLRYLPVFAIGVVVFRVWSSQKLSLISQKFKSSIGYLFILTSILLLISRPTELSGILGDPLYLQAFAFAFLVIGLFMNPIRIFVNRILDWYGKLSYSVYLLQPIIIWHMRHLTSRIYETVGNTFGFLLTTLLLMAIISLTAFITEFCIEKPFINLGKRVSKRLAI